ncbi:hypothetical protein BDF22DRAFT_620340 [Syncephalis plumigaleata]|nr:hypothetical protein BDF22DRAFT_620340 [Syncephalis plumigaleata]
MSQVASLPLLQVLPSDSSLASLSSGSETDALLLLYTNRKQLLAHPFVQDTPLQDLLTAYAQVDQGFDADARLLPCESAPGGKLIVACTGSLAGDVDDVRRFADTAAKALKRAREAGCNHPVVAVADPPTLTNYERYLEVTLLSLLHESYIPLQAREANAGKPAAQSLTGLSVVSPSNGGQSVDRIVSTVAALEQGRRIARDLGGSDPERMAPPRFADYVVEAMAPVADRLEIEVIDDPNVMAREFPLLAAVARCSLAVPRHHPRVVRLEYRSPEPTQVKEHLYLVGKGITYDTGGADVKAGGHMRGMSRDKCGAAGVAGFLRTVAELQPRHLNVTAYLALVRNSIGADSYVSDEVIEARSGVRVIVGNTDAEGRMVMTDLLCKCREEVLATRKRLGGVDAAPKASLFTVATLTGHVIRAYGNYGAAVPNGPAYNELKVPQRLLEAGEQWGDPFELSRLRREDMDLGRARCGMGDVISSNSAPSTMTNRGHMFPAGFMIIAAGLEKHGSACTDPNQRIAYTHLDVAGSAEESNAPGLSLPRTTASPILTLAGAYLINN